jgi:hypothetical protein
MCARAEYLIGSSGAAHILAAAHGRFYLAVTVRAF